jgi:hypothetical protein
MITQKDYAKVSLVRLRPIKALSFG